jgi:hypothetical protein
MSPFPQATTRCGPIIPLALPSINETRSNGSPICLQETRGPTQSFPCYTKHPGNSTHPGTAWISLRISPDRNLSEWQFMARAQDRKRARADDPSQEHRPHKRTKSRGSFHQPSNFPPQFWDNLSKVWLTRRALRELDRRNGTQPPPGPATPAVYTTDRARFARHGGPDLRHLRGVRLHYADIDIG